MTNMLPMSTPAKTMSSTFFCHACADRQGMLNDLHLVSTNPSTYQIDKARKHVGPTSSSTKINSVLNSSSTADLDHLASNALREGFLEVECGGTRSLVYQSTGYLGTQFIAAIPALPLDSFRFVLSTSSSLGHGYAVSSTQYDGVTCFECGCAVTS
jgi:hypothetical protein